MRADQAQAEIDGLDDPEHRAREAEAVENEDLKCFERFIQGARAVCVDRGYGKVANELDGTWSKLGHPVSESVLRATMRENGERNYFRMEWVPYFARHSEECAQALLEMAGRGEPEVPVEDFNANLIDGMRGVLAPAQVNRIVAAARRPKARRSRR